MKGGSLASKKQDPHAVAKTGLEKIKAVAVSLKLNEMMTYPVNILIYYDMLKKQVSGH